MDNNRGTWGVGNEIKEVNSWLCQPIISLWWRYYAPSGVLNLETSIPIENRDIVQDFEEGRHAVSVSSFTGG